MGVWRSHCKENEALVREVRQAYRETLARRGRGAVRIAHVRSHTAIPGNELADVLADAGMKLAEGAPDTETAGAGRIMRAIALAGNTPGQQRPRAAPTTNHPPFTIFDTAHTTPHDDEIDDG